MKIENRQYEKLNENDLFICALGYEIRSWFLLEQNLSTRNKENTLILCLEKHGQAMNVFEEIEKKQIMVVESKYNEINTWKNQLLDFIQNNLNNNENQKIHFDYSSMPRSWYCYFPIMLSELIGEKRKASFWYVSGDYPNEYSNYPSAGIDSISVFSGRSLPAVDIKRFHIIGLGYDHIRTETMISIIEPESLISCYAYNPMKNETKENAFIANKRIIDRSLISAALPIDNFCGIIDKLCELVYDLKQNGQVIIVPDGPKPLIMAMSLIPALINKNGITCLHISRNSIYYKKINVKPRENEIYGFQVEVPY